MKKVQLMMVMLFTLAAMVSCDNDSKTDTILKEEFPNTISLKNGLGEKVDVELGVLEDGTSLDLTQTQLDDLCRELNSEAKFACKNRATHVPKSILISADKGRTDSIYVMMDHIASNAYGVPGNLTTVFYFNYDKFKATKKSDLFEVIINDVDENYMPLYNIISEATTF